MKRLVGDQDHIASNLETYIQGFSPDVRDISERFDFYIRVDRLAKAGLLCQVTERFANIDLHPDRVDNHEMGLVFEELIRRFAEISNETAGEHFTPRDAIRLMVNLLFIEDDEALSRPGIVHTIYDPTTGTGLPRVSDGSLLFLLHLISKMRPAADGWHCAEGDAQHYERARALFPPDLVFWVQESQPKAWEALTKTHGKAAETVLLDRVRKQMDARGTLDVLYAKGWRFRGSRNPCSSPGSSRPWAWTRSWRPATRPTGRGWCTW